MRGARSMEHGAWSTEHGAWSTEHGARSMEHGARSTEHGAWSTHTVRRSYFSTTVSFCGTRLGYSTSTHRLVRLVVTLWCKSVSILRKGVGGRGLGVGEVSRSFSTHAHVRTHARGSE